MLDPVAKTGDPSTSWDAGEKFKEAGVHLKHYDIIIQALQMVDEPATAAELSQIVGLTQHQISRRVKEMEGYQRYLISICDPRICTVKNSRCMTYEIYDSSAFS